MLNLSVLQSYDTQRSDNSKFYRIRNIITYSKPFQTSKKLKIFSSVSINRTRIIKKSFRKKVLLNEKWIKKIVWSLIDFMSWEAGFKVYIIWYKILIQLRESKILLSFFEMRFFQQKSMNIFTCWKNLSSSFDFKKNRLKIPYQMVLII